MTTNLIARGTYGKIYKIADNIVIKRMNVRYKKSREVISNNINESAFLATHGAMACFIPHIYNVQYDVNTRHIMITQKYVGMTLEERTEQWTLEKRIETFWDVLCQLARALMWLKVTKISHGDIKPTNICINDNLEVYLIDWGFVTMVTPCSPSWHGTDKFVHPRFLRGAPVDATYDTFSVGLCMIYYITGTISWNDIWTKHTTEIEFDQILESTKEEFKNTVPTEIWQILHRMTRFSNFYIITPYTLYCLCDTRLPIMKKYPLDNCLICKEMPLEPPTLSVEKETWCDHVVAAMVDIAFDQIDVEDTLGWAIKLFYMFIKQYDVTTYTETLKYAIACMYLSTCLFKYCIIEPIEYDIVCKKEMTENELNDKMLTVLTALKWKVYPIISPVETTRPKFFTRAVMIDMYCKNKAFRFMTEKEKMARMEHQMAEANLW